jgi:uncharacterized coiled-coil protein SlyX
MTTGGSIMAKCEHHDDYMAIHETLKDDVKEVDKRVDKLENKVDGACEKIEGLKEALHEQRNDHRETEVYVKTLYKKFDELTLQMQGVISKLDAYITTMITVKSDTDHNSSFNKTGKALIFDIIKWVIITVLTLSFLGSR